MLDVGSILKYARLVYDTIMAVWQITWSQVLKVSWSFQTNHSGGLLIHSRVNVTQEVNALTPLCLHCAGGMGVVCANAHNNFF